ncbi:MAG: peptidoglycan-binding domain-containing protein, partial [Patescibacteria group bacterium]
MITTVSLSAPVAFGQTTADLQAQIAALLAQITALQAQLNASTSGPTTSYTFTRNLTVGSRGADVTALQNALIASGHLKISAPTGYFGPMTKAALAAWQKDKNISPAVGYFGPITRAAMSSVTPGPGPVVVPSGTDLQVSLAADTPGAKTIGSGTAFNPALKFVLAAGSKAVKVTAVKVMKAGFLANTNLNGVEIVDAMGSRYGNVVTSINADNTILLTFPATPITVGAGQSATFLIRFNLLMGNYTGTVGFSIDSVSAITADTTALAGAFPLSGAVMNVVNGGT